MCTDRVLLKERPCLGLQHAQRHLDACTAQALDAAARDLGEGVERGHDHARDAHRADELGTGGRLAIVRAGLEGHVER